MLHENILQSFISVILRFQTVLLLHHKHLVFINCLSFVCGLIKRPPHMSGVQSSHCIHQLFLSVPECSRSLFLILSGPCSKLLLHLCPVVIASSFLFVFSFSVSLCLFPRYN